MSWLDKIQEGYIYQISDGPFDIYTEYQEAINYGKALEARGLPDALIQESIKITDDDNLYTSTVFTPISQIAWKKLEDKEKSEQ